MVPVEQLPERVDVAVLSGADQRPAVGDLFVRLLEAGALQVGRVDLGRLVLGPHVLHDRDHGLVDPGGLDRRRRRVHPVGGGHRAGRRADGRVAGRRRARREGARGRQGARGREGSRGRRGSRGRWGRRHRAGRTRRGGRRRAPTLHPRQVGVRGVVDGPRARWRPTGVGAALLGVGRPVPCSGGPGVRPPATASRDCGGVSVMDAVRPARSRRSRPGSGVPPAPTVIAPRRSWLRPRRRRRGQARGVARARPGSGRVRPGGSPRGRLPASRRRRRQRTKRSPSLDDHSVPGAQTRPLERSGSTLRTEHTCGSEALVTGAPPTRTRLVDMHLTCGERS